MRGYEFIAAIQNTGFISLRIPMRGYETDPYKLYAVASKVTNPHAGL